jgi:uncharacterized alpha-E superfamily protein
VEQIGAGRSAGPEVLQALTSLAVQTGLAPPGVPSLSMAPRLFGRALLGAMGDAQASFGIGFNLQAMGRSALVLRERLSPEHWDLICSMPAAFGAAMAAPSIAQPGDAPVLRALDHLALQLAAATGAQTDRMTRDVGWRLLSVGRLLERLIGLTTRMLAFLKAGALQQGLGIGLLLDLFDSTITFRARYQRHGDLLALTDLLVLDPSNPRSYAGTLRRLRTELGKLPRGGQGDMGWLARLPAEGAGLTLESLRGASEDKIAAALHCTSASLCNAASALASDLGQHYFAHSHDPDSIVQV